MEALARLTGTYVPIYQGLSATDLVRPAREQFEPCFPFDRPDALSFYRARNAIYHLFKALGSGHRPLSVLAPDYNSGNEILAMRAAGATIHYCPVDRNMRMDPGDVERLWHLHKPDILYVIHYVGWSQPMTELVDVCRRRGMLLFEDCALALLSERDGQPLGTFGDWSVFCLYKTLPVPNGAVLVQNTARCESLDRLPLRQAGAASVLGRTAELLVQRARGRMNGVGAALQRVKRGLGRAAGALRVERANVGDIGFNLADVDLAISPLTERLLGQSDFQDIRRRRRANYLQLASELQGHVSMVFPELCDGVCPLFFPIRVVDKHATAMALQARGIDALEFWNESMDGGEEMGPDSRYLRQHVLELPIHQDLTPRHISHLARQVCSLHLAGA